MMAGITKQSLMAICPFLALAIVVMGSSKQAGTAATDFVTISSYLYIHIVHNGVELVRAEVGSAAALLILPSVLSQVAVCVSLFLCDFSFLKPECVVFYNVLEIPYYVITTNGLGVVARNDVGYPLRLFEAVFVIKEEFLRFAIYDNTPLAMGRADVKLSIFQPAGYSVFLAELIDCNLLFAKSGTNWAAAVTQPISMLSSFFRGRKMLLIFFLHPLTDFAMREVKYFLLAFML